jgi:uracil-DNA glycosylase family protein
MAPPTPYPGAATYVPASRLVPDLAAAAAGCQGCPLHEGTTGTVFGEGNVEAQFVLVGEQPGDVEDRRGRPFVGPAGRLLDRALEDAGLPREQGYVTNAVKHFKFTMATNGNRRIHAKPDHLEVAACRPWLLAELNRIRPRLVILLGATAGLSLLGPEFRVTRDRGRLRDGPAGSGARMLATLHPSAVLRTEDSRRDAAYAGFVADLQLAAKALEAFG